MAGNLLLLAGTIVNLRITGSGTLATAVAAQADSADFDNTTNLMRWGNFQLSAGFSVAPAVNAEIALYQIPKMDGTNFADIGTNAFNPNHYIGSFWVTKSQTALQRMTLESVRLQPFIYRYYILNLSAQTIAANWLLDLYPAAAKYT